MRFTPISRHIYNIITKDSVSDWFRLNKYNQWFFIKGVFKGKSIDEVFELYGDYDNQTNFFDYLQYLYDYEANWKDKRAIYEIYHRLKNKKQ